MTIAWTSEELHAYARDGYVVREGFVGDDEVSTLRDSIEVVIERVAKRARRPDAGPEARLADGHRIQFSSRAGIQWEWHDGSREIRLVEPCTHLHPSLASLAADPRLEAMARSALDVADVALFTSKLNLKRPHEGSEFPWHQDYTYWYATIEERARDVMTIMVFLDDASVANGAIRVLPGSHRNGPAPRDRDEPTGFLADAARLAVERELALELPAGSVVAFPSLLVHRSAPNDSDLQRRALLFSYQPGGRPSHQDLPFRAERVDRLP